MSTTTNAARNALSDPRHFQIVSLVSLALWGRFALGLEISALHFFVAASAALVTEFAGTRVRGQRFDPR